MTSLMLIALIEQPEAHKLFLNKESKVDSMRF